MTWTDIPNSSLEPGAPARSVDAIALRDNVTALAEGAPGAPRIRTVALKPPAAGANYLMRILQDSEVAASEATSYPPWDTSTDRNQTTISAVALVAGVVRVTYEHKVNSSGRTSYVRILKNGTLVSELTTSTTSYLQQSVDVAVSVGDTLVVQQKAGSSPTPNISYMKNVRIYSANPDFAIA